MEATVKYAATADFGTAFGRWITASAGLARATTQTAASLLLRYSRAGLLLRGPRRPARRI